MKQIEEQMEMARARQSDDPMMNQLGDNFSNNLNGNDLDFDPAAKKLTVHSRKIDLPADLTSVDLESLGESEVGEWILSIVGLNESYVIYHLPGSVIKVTGDVHYEILDTGSVKIPLDLGKILSGGETEGFEIYYE